MALNYFNVPSVGTDVYAVSYINRSALVAAIQADSTDTYFDSTSEISKVIVYYSHENGRQIKRVIHDGPSLLGQVAWFSTARDGTWQKTRVWTFDSNGAGHDLFRPAIGSSEDLIRTDGTTFLNIS